MMATNIRLKDMAIAEVRGVAPDDTIRRALALMDNFNVDQVPIFSGERSLVGLVTRRRLILVRQDFGEVRVGEIEWPQHSEELVRPPNTRLDDVFDHLFNNDFVLVSEDGENITGIVTINDVAKYLYDSERAGASVD